MSAPVAAAKATKTAAKKAAPSHPVYSDMIKKAIAELKEKSGSSKAAILKFILAQYKLGDNVTMINAHLRLAIKRGVASGALKQVKGTGASGSFKLGEKKAAAPKKAAAKKPSAKKSTSSPKKAAAKKTKSPKKAAAKKPKTAAKKAASKPKTAKKTKSPKKAAAKPKAKKAQKA